jgi:hypothetical protein
MGSPFGIFGEVPVNTLFRRDREREEEIAAE